MAYGVCSARDADDTGVGLFYAGLVRRKNIISMIALSFVVLAVVSIFWMVIGYSLAFGPDIGGVIGNLDYAFLKRSRNRCR